MDNSGATARLAFLKGSARALCADSPSTTAHLLSTHNRLLFDQCKPLATVQEREFCPACGIVRVPGWTSSVSTTSRKSRRNRRSAVPLDSVKGISPQSQMGVEYKCLRCYRHATQSLQKSPREIPNQPQKASSSQGTPQELDSRGPGSATFASIRSATESEQKKTSQNASSKKRAKSRKNQGLLTALAAGKQQSRPQTSSSSLDLLDFLQ